MGMLQNDNNVKQAIVQAESDVFMVNDRNCNDLLLEFDYLYRRIFKAIPSPELQQKYIDVHHSYGKYISQKQQIRITKLIRQKVNLVALELFWRLKDKDNLLTKKVGIIFYLTEVNPTHQRYYISFINHRLAFLHLGLFTLRSVFALIHGAYLFKKNKLAM